MHLVPHDLIRDLICYSVEQNQCSAGKALIDACEMNDPELAMILLQHYDADPNSRSENNASALHWSMNENFNPMRKHTLDLMCTQTVAILCVHTLDLMCTQTVGHSYLNVHVIVYVWERMMKISGGRQNNLPPSETSTSGAKNNSSTTTSY
jgi:ankyrin repeat protein